MLGVGNTRTNTFFISALKKLLAEWRRWTKKNPAYSPLLDPQMVLNIRSAANFLIVYEDTRNTLSSPQVLLKTDPAPRSISIWKNMYILELRT